MAAVRMYIDKFKSEVLIEKDHPLAIAQREKESVRSGELTATHSVDASAAAATVATVPSATPDSISNGNPDSSPTNSVPSSLEVVAARLTEKSRDEIQALAKEAGLDCEAAHESLIADLAILIDGGHFSIDPPAPSAPRASRRSRRNK